MAVAAQTKIDIDSGVDALIVLMATAFAAAEKAELRDVAAATVGRIQAALPCWVPPGVRAAKYSAL